MATSILQSIQKVYAEALTKNIMNALFPTQAQTPQVAGSGFNFNSGFGIDYGGGFAEGGSLVEDQIQGPGTGTSDSILAWVDSVKKFIRVGDGEWIMKQKAVNYYGPNIMAALNRGLIPRKILDVSAKFAEGGSLRGMMPPTGREGAYGLSADFAGNFDSNVYVTNRIDGNGIMGALGGVIKSQVDKRVEKNIQENAKKYDMLLGLTRRR